MGGFVEYKSVGGVRHANSVRLSGVRVSDLGLVHLKSLPYLEELYISGADISDRVFTVVHDAAHIIRLKVSNTYITDKGLKYLANLGPLEDLDLSLNPGITDLGMANLRSLTKLGRLDITGTNVTGQGMQELHRFLPSLTVISGF
jgi:hypothetical protein